MRTPRSTAAVSGLLIALLGLWGGLVAFIGPYFDYSFGVNEAWHFTTDRLWLNILPGAAAVVGGLLIAFSARRAVLRAGALLALIAGAWFVVGPAVSLTWESATGPIGRPLFGSVRQMLELVGYFYGLGALIVAFAAYSLGRVSSLSAVAAREPAGVTAARPAEPTTQEPLAAGPASTPPRRRGGFLRRRRGAALGEEHRSPAGQQQPR